MNTSVGFLWDRIRREAFVVYASFNIVQLKKPNDPMLIGIYTSPVVLLMVDCIMANTDSGRRL